MKIGKLKKRDIEIKFDGGSLTSDSGLHLLKMADDKISLTRELAKVMPDPRDQSRVTHSMQSMFKQRIFGLAAGYEDLNDHEFLRKDVAFQTAAGCDGDMAGDSSLSNFEKWATREFAISAHKIFFENFINSYEHVPTHLTFDFDPSDSEIFGNQEGRYYQTYYRSYCYLPLYVYCGNQLLVAYLRPSHRHGAHHAAAILKILVREVRKKWPKVRITFRGDCAFQKPHLYNWCEKNDVTYVTGIIGNERLKKKSKKQVDKARKYFESSEEPSKMFGQFQYQADSWSGKRKVIVKAEHNEKGANTRYLVTNMRGTPEEIYNEKYCPRGDMENRIQETQRALFADRVSSMRFTGNQLRMILSAAAYILMNVIKQNCFVKRDKIALRVDTIRNRFLKVAAVITKNTRRITFHLPSNYPYKKDLLDMIESLAPT